MDDFRLVLIIITGLAIVGIFLHGRVSLRRSNEDKEEAERKDPVYDDTGFDEFGVSKKRVLEDTKPAEHKKLVEPAVEDDDIIAAASAAVEQYQTDIEDFQDRPIGDLDAVTASMSKSAAQAREREEQKQASECVVEEAAVEETVVEAEPEKPYQPQYMETVAAQLEGEAAQQVEPVVEQAVADEPVEKPEDSSLMGEVKSSIENIVLPKRAPRKRRPRKDPKFTENQLEMFGGAPEPAKQQAQAPKPALPEEVIALNVMTPEGTEISGAQLLPAFLTLGLKFGEFDIFHRHQDSAGNGPVLFSVANMFKPGVFDLDNMENFATRGVSLFMSLPLPQGDAQQTFNMMHNAARKLAEEFGGQVLDGSRSVLTKQKVQHYCEQIREFERKQLLAR